MIMSGERKKNYVPQPGTIGVGVPQPGTMCLLVLVIIVEFIYLFTYPYPELVRESFEIPNKTLVNKILFRFPCSILDRITCPFNKILCQTVTNATF